MNRRSFGGAVFLSIPNTLWPIFADCGIIHINMNYPENLLTKLDIELSSLTTDQEAGLDYALSKLPPVMRDVLLLHYQKDSQFTRIASRMGYTASWIRDCHKQALERLEKNKDYIINGYNGELDRQRAKQERIASEEQAFRDDLRARIGSMADTPLSDHLPSRIVRALSRAGIITVSDLAVMYQKEPNRYVRGVGEKLRQELDDFASSLWDA